MGQHKLDDRDLKILRILSTDGRIKVSELAKQLNLSAAPCWERLRKLEKLGFVKGYKAEIALAKIAAHITVFVVVELEYHRAESFQIFERMIEKVDEITSCWAIGGGYDYLMQVITRDIQTYQTLMDKLLEQRIGIAHYTTYVVTKPIKQNSTLPFDVLLGTDKEG